MQIRNLFLVVAIFGIFLTAEAQSLTKIKQDSLMVIWNDLTQADTIRLNAVHRIASEGFMYKNPDSSFYYSQLQFDLAKSTGNKKWQAKALYSQANSFQVRGELSLALEYIDEAFELFESIDDKAGMANSLVIKGGVLTFQGNLEEALEYLLRSLKLNEEIGNEKSIASCLSTIGMNYFTRNDHFNALKYLNRGKNIAEKIGDQRVLMSILNGLGNIYNREGEYDLALELFLQVLEASEKSGDKRAIAGSLSNIGNSYQGKKDYVKAIDYMTRSLAIAEEMSLKRGIVGLTFNIGNNYKRQANSKTALEYFERSLAVAEEIGSKGQMAQILSAMGRIFQEQNNLNKALSYGTRSLELARETGGVSDIRQASATLKNAYKATGQYREALEMYELTIKMRDSINNKENQKALIAQKIQGDYDKQKAIDDVENEKDVAVEAAKTKAQRNISWGIGVGLLLISVLAFVIFNRLKVTRQQKAIIEEQKKKVEQSEKYKEQFLANMSHEIRTPMHAISGMIKILDRKEHPPTQDVYLNAMRTSSDNLVVILNDVLDLSKIEAGKLEIESIPMNPRLVIENVIQILKYKAEEKGLTLSYDVTNDVPVLVMGDPTRLNQILINLVGNAIKFTEKGSVDISLDVENERLRFQVNDTGIGIPKKEQASIFGAFEQAKNSTAPHFGGTGLGLSISKQLVELQQGSIGLESTEGSGSTFYVTLPLNIADADAVGADLISEEKLKTMATSLEGIRILFAEDNPFNQMIAQDDLSYYINGITIKTVENGTLAVEAFKTASYDLILMDVQMPEMNGFEATEKIRAIEKSEGKETRIPIIAMTASLLKTEIDNCYDAGMDNYIPKPYKPEELIGPIYEEVKK